MGIDPDPETILLRFARPESASKSRPECSMYMNINLQKKC